MKRIIASLFLIPVFTASQADLIANGSFESDAISGEYLQLNPGSTQLPGWIITQPIDVVRTGWVASHGIQSLDMCGSVNASLGQVSQVVPTVGGQRYVLTFDLAGNYASQFLYTLRVEVPGHTQNFQFNSTGFNAVNMGWRRETLSFTADSSSSLIRFTAADALPSQRGSALDNVVVKALSGPVSGTATLQGYLGSTDGEPLEVEVWQNGMAVETLDGNYGSDGVFAFSPTVSGAAVLKFRYRTGLWKSVPVTLGPTPIENLTVNIVNGDCDHDNEVGIGDYSILSAIYGLSVGDPGYDTNADLNGDTTVDIADYAILSGSYGELGD